MTKVDVEKKIRSSEMSGFRLSSYATSRLFATHQKSLMTDTTPKATQHTITMSYTFGQSVHGPILVARTHKGVCALLLGGVERDFTDLKRDLIRRFPKSELREVTDKQAEKEMEQICQYLDKPISDLDLALDLQGTTFQLAVWKALMKIPPGSTETYLQLTKRAKLPLTSARAVANACGQNHIAFLVPCHRIVRSDGQLGGYHWGAQMKKKMLRSESNFKT